MPHCYLGVASLRTAIGAPSSEDTALLSALEAGSEEVDDDCHRTFQPYTATKYFSPEHPRRLLLNDDLLAVTTLKSDVDGDGVYEKTLVASTDYLLKPFNAPTGPQPGPYSEIEIVWSSGNFVPTYFPRSIQLVGIWAWWRDLLTLTATVGIGGITSSATTLPLSAVTEVEAGNTVLIESEQMYISAVGASSCTVERGVNGTTAVAHLAAVAVARYRYPAEIVQAARLNAVKNYRRKDAPFGVTGSDAMGTIVVPRFDSDYERKISGFRLRTAA